MRKLVISTLLVMQVLFVFAQNGTGVTGKVVDSKTQKPLQNVVTSIQNTNLTQTTDASGKFTFNDVAAGKQLLLIKTVDYRDQLLQVDIVEGQILDLGVVVLEEDITDEQQTSLITITDNDLGDDNSGSESTSGLLQASRDAFQQTAAFNWGQARFRVRGLDNQYGTTMINGVVMNKLYDGRPNWSNWGGLNDATRNQEFTSGSAPSDYTFGGILGTQEINTRASMYRKGSRISAAGTNTNYNGRLMGTVATGMRNDGWAYTISASRRFAQEGYFEGTTYDANSFFASVERKLTDNNSLNFTSIYAHNKRGKNSPNTKEVTDLAGEQYNSYWGYNTDGQKRNSRYKEIEEPIFILSDYWKLTAKTNLNLNVSYQFGKVGNSRLDYQGVNNPDPTYYRNMPSYYTSLYNTYYDEVTLQDPSVFQPGGLGGIPTPDYAAAANPDDAKFLGQRQINWGDLYLANTTPIIQNNTIVGRTPAQSLYILYEDRTDDSQWTANAILNSQLADNIAFNAGGNFTKVKSHNFKNMLDLLGGSYYEDFSTFGVGDQHQSDLNNPFKIVKEGDHFGYDYNLYGTKYNAFTQFKFVYKKVDFYLAQTFNHTEYQREGNYKNGYYPNNSLGYSNVKSYNDFGFKGGMTYKLSGRHFINVNGAYMSQAPTMRSVFNNARVNNNINNLDSEIISSADVSYIINAPKFKARLTAYISKIQRASETSFFFSEGTGEEDLTGGSDSNEFVAELLTNVDKRNMGLELGAEYAITSTLKAIVSGAYGEFIYANNPNVTLSNDESARVTNYGTAFIKNYKRSGTPQTAASFGLEYRDPKFWWVGANINYLGNNYIDIAPITRTARFFRNPADVNGAPFPEATQERADQLLKQEKFADFSLLNLTGGKSWRISGKTIGFFASVNNALDKIYKTGGYEQARNANYRALNQDAASGTPVFAPKYFYGYGRTYFVNLYLNF